LRRLKELGITHVIVSKVLGAVHSKEYHQYELDKDQWRKIEGLVQRGLEPLVIEGDTCLYQVRERLVEKAAHIANPFLLFPPQAFDLMSDLSSKNYSKARLELDQLKGFFPGDDQLAKKESELQKMGKVK
jgi:hypothetical protein